MTPKLPPGWKYCELETLVDFNPKNLNKDNSEALFAPMKLIPTKYLDKMEFETKLWKDIKSGFMHFQKGDVVVAKITPCFENAKSAIVEHNRQSFGAGTTEIFVLRPKEEKVLAKYLLAFFKTHHFLQKCTQNMRGAVGQKRVPKEYLLKFPVPLPQPDEQKRIVARLDQLLARVDSCRAHLDRAAAAIKRFRQSVLNAAVTGDLSKNWRRKFPLPASGDVFIKSICNNKTGFSKRKQADLTDNTLSVKDSEKRFEIVETWRWFRIKQVALKMSTGPFGSMLHKKDYVTNGIPVINPTNIQDNKILPSSKMMVCPDTMRRLAKYCLSENDVVIARRGDLSKCAVVTNKESGWLCGTGSFFLKVGIDPNYFRIFYISEFCQSALLADAIGSTMVNLNQKVLASIPIPVPPIQEQLEIVKIVCKLNNFADQFESKLTAARERVDNLTASILAKAFRGELL